MMRQSEFKMKYDSELGRYIRKKHLWRRGDGCFQVLWKGNENSC